MIPVYLPKRMANAKQLTIDDIDSFAKARCLSSNQKLLPIYACMHMQCIAMDFLRTRHTQGAPRELTDEIINWIMRV